MKISTKGRYALRIMIDLAENANRNIFVLKDISARQGNCIKIYGTDYADADKGRICKKLSGNNGGYIRSSEKSRKNIRAGDIIRQRRKPCADCVCKDDVPNRW